MKNVLCVKLTKIHILFFKPTLRDWPSSWPTG